jgi:hypothetical protein
VKDSTIAMWLAIMLVIEVAAIASLAWLALSGAAMKMNKMLAVGVIMLTIGLGVQVVRSLHYFEFGRYPVDKIFPWWVLKDFGGSLIIFYLAFIWRKEVARQPNTVEESPCARKSTPPRRSSTASKSSPRR